MAIFQAEETVTAINSNNKFKKADAFANISVILTDESGEEVKRKLCAAPLHADKELGQLLIDGFTSDIDFAEKLKSKLVIDYNSATPKRRGLSL